MLAGDKVNVLSVEFLMSSLLSKFVQCATNDCDYAGKRYELIAKWVHPLYLKVKTKASKTGNRNWKQARNGPFCEE